jgi:hypothetical protein
LTCSSLSERAVIIWFEKLFLFILATNCLTFCWICTFLTTSFKGYISLIFLAVFSECYCYVWMFVVNLPVYRGIWESSFTFLRNICKLRSLSDWRLSNIYLLSFFIFNILNNCLRETITLINQNWDPEGMTGWLCGTLFLWRRMRSRWRGLALGK